MIFETLYESSQRGELLLLNGGYCRWHKRRDNVIVIYEIISQMPGVGQQILKVLKEKDLPIIAKCPQDLKSNNWYKKNGFILLSTETTNSGRTLNVWILNSQRSEILTQDHLGI